MRQSPKLQNIRGLIFDKDGTLFDFHASWRPVMHLAAAMASGGMQTLAARMLEAGGYDPASGTFRADSIIAAGHAGELAHLWHSMGAAMDREQLQLRLDTLFRLEGPRNAVPVTDLPRLFAHLSQCGHVLGLATNDGQDAAAATVQRFGLGHMLCFVAGYDSGYGAKPGPGMALACCEAMNLAPEQVALVGDSEHDMMTARAANLGACIGVLSGAGTMASLHSLADLVLDDITTLPEVLSV